MGGGLLYVLFGDFDACVFLVVVFFIVFVFYSCVLSLGVVCISVLHLCFMICFGCIVFFVIVL